jgi:murein tripeptide amidase MpaA
MFLIASLRNTAATLTLIAGALCGMTHAATLDALSTHAERTAFAETGRYEEVIRLCHAFQAAHPTRVQCLRFGTTPEGRPMQVLVVAPPGVRTAAQAQRKGLPVLLVQGGIHSGEIEGKDAGFQVLRNLLQATANPALDKQVLLFVPVFNIDGHERFGAWNRPNQRGPKEMGWRVTAQNLNLNRDYAKAKSPEMRAMLALVNAWDPILTMDLHATDGAQFEHDIAIMVEPASGGDASLRPSGLALRTTVVGDLAKQGHLPLPFYPSFVEEDNPSSGFEDGVSPPRFSTGYFLTRNRFAMLVETHSWKPYAARVQSTAAAIVSVVNQTAAHGASWQQAAQLADQTATGLAGKPVDLAWKVSDKTRTIEFRGYAYSRTMSDVSGALMTRYDEGKPEVWRLPIKDELLPSLTLQAPHLGYLVAAAQAEHVAVTLNAHGLRYQRMTQPLNNAQVQAFATTRAIPDAKPTEGRQRLHVTGNWLPHRRSFAAGSLFVPSAQPRLRLVMHLLEPLAPDSLTQWGEFNIFFERKEYMEPYVAEQVAREQLAADPALAKSFAEQLASDPAFAADAEARLNFFYRRHPAWDALYQQPPIYRLEKQPGTYKLHAP